VVPGLAAAAHPQLQLALRGGIDHLRVVQTATGRGRRGAGGCGRPGGTAAGSRGVLDDLDPPGELVAAVLDRVVGRDPHLDRAAQMPAAVGGRGDQDLGELTGQCLAEGLEPLVVLGADLDPVDVGHDHAVGRHVLGVGGVALDRLGELDGLEPGPECAREEPLDGSLEPPFEVL
jgi:hypothetical protein